MSKRKVPKSSPSSKATVRIGAQEPRLAIEPVKVDGADGHDAALLYADATGKTLDPWQEAVLCAWLARDRWDEPCYLTCGLSVPRQNGKNEVLEAYELYKMLMCHENILHTAHLVSTAKKSFERMTRIFTDPSRKRYKNKAKAIRRTNGEQGIYLEWREKDPETGEMVKYEACIEYSSRSRGGARGATYSVVVFDEAQELTDEQVEALMPTLAASPTGYRQQLYTGTPPSPTCPGTIFANVRRSALGDEPSAKTCWHEWSVAQPPTPGTPFKAVMDAVYATNPAMGIRLDIDFASSEFMTLAPDGFARERLGWWAEKATTSSVISEKLWASSALDEIGADYPAKMGFALKFTPDGSQYALAGVKTDALGNAAVEIVEVGTTGQGTRPLAEALFARRTKAAVVVVDGMSLATALCDNLAALGAPKNYVVRPGAQDVIAAAQCFYDGLIDGSVKHTKQPLLTDSATHATKRNIGNRGGWGFGGTDTHDSAPIEAVALAYWGIRNTKRNPKRKQKLL